jgi:excisionase family DNA binding protein
MVEPMMTARQVAELLGVHENWVYDQAVGGDLPSYKIGGARRFDPVELRQWITDHRAAERVRERRELRVRTPKTARLEAHAAQRDGRALEAAPRKAARRSRSKPTDGGAGEQSTLFEI